MSQIIDLCTSGDEGQRPPKRRRWAKGLLHLPSLCGNPLDHFLDVVQEVVAVGVCISWEAVTAKAAAIGLTPEMVREAFENWCSLEVMEGFSDPDLEGRSP